MNGNQQTVVNSATALVWGIFGMAISTEQPISKIRNSESTTLAASCPNLTHDDHHSINNVSVMFRQ